MDFKKITHQDMPILWQYLKNEPGRTTDFSYGGILMWVDYFSYEYAIENDTLYIKGVVEDDRAKPAFSLPLGNKSFRETLFSLKEYCNQHSIPLEFSAVPEYALKEIRETGAKSIEELTHWGDYLYEIDHLAGLEGKKMSKKRNHVHQFESHYPDWEFKPLTKNNAEEVLTFMDMVDLEGDCSDEAVAERKLNRLLLQYIHEGDDMLEGGLLYACGQLCAFTIGDVKGDTLFVHVEKALREYTGSYEMINWQFAKSMKEKYPELRYVNREDDAGDEGLRRAKESYHPCEILKKYNVLF